jgi:hypothetical protein
MKQKLEQGTKRKSKQIGDTSSLKKKIKTFPKHQNPSILHE